MTIEEAVSRNPEVMSGELCFAGTRVPVRNLFDHLRSGATLGEFFDGFPRVRTDQVEAVLRDAYEGLVHDLDRKMAA